MTAASPDRRAIITEALRKIDDLTARLEIAEKSDTEPIAVVGMACRLPGGVDTPAQYWQFLKDGGDGVIRVPADRWDADAYYSDDHTRPGTICNREGGFLTSWQPDQFDAEFFGISPREAVAMDPQQRLLLEVAWEALENAGVTPDSIRNTQTGIYVGLTTSDYYWLSVAGGVRPEDFDPYLPFGNASNFAAGRLSYFLGVHGPAVVIDTACSSSLVAIHLACQSLRKRETDQALAAGTNLIMSPENSIACSRWGMLAPDGQCKTFDAAANGYVRSEGCGVVVLKRLSDALRDGDSVFALVRGSAVNQDGPSSGQTVPSGPAQQAVLRAALASARVQPSEIDYVEAHGTGTALGDPIELEALNQVFPDTDRTAPLVLGSVKTNMGHLENSAGIAGFIKTVLSLTHGYIPPHLHFTQLTPNASAGSSRFTIAAQGMPWPEAERPRRAGVSSFGVSGTNAHVVLEQAPAPESVAVQPEPVVNTLVISGKTPERIAPIAAMLADWMDTDGEAAPLADVAYTVNQHRGRYRSFAAVCARDRTQAVAGLRALAAGEPATGVVEQREAPHGSGTVFVYSGQGSQWAGMGQRLLTEEPAFAAAIDELEPAFVEQAGFSLRDVLVSGEPVVGIERIQPVLVGMQLALTALWRSYGVEPTAVIGHSMGEVTAAVVAGALTPADGLKVIATRSKLMSRLAGQGAMALLELGAEDAEKLVADYPDITVAVYAAPQQTVIAGPPDQVDAAIAVVDAQGLLARRVEVDVASHHPTVDPILAELRTALAGLAAMTPKIPLISTVGQTNGAAPAFDADYWVVNLRNPVRFSQAVAAAFEKHGNRTFVEVSPHPLLTHGIGETLASVSSGDRFIVTSAMKRGDDETLSVHTQLATLAATPPNTGGVRRTDIPPSPWLHASYWIEKKPAAARLPDVHPLLGVHVEMPSGRDHVWQADIETETIPWLADHKVHGQAVMPAAGFAEMALAAARQALGLPVGAVGVNALDIEQTLALDGQTRVTTQFTQGDDGNRVEIHASLAGGKWSRYAVADIAATDQDAPAERRDTESGTDIELPDEIADHPEYCIHPALLDAALRQLAGAVPAESPDTSYLPVSMATLRVFGPSRRRARCHAELVEQAPCDYRGRVVLTDDVGAVTAELTGIGLRPADPRALRLPLEQKVFDAVWVQSSTPQTGSGDDRIPAGSWLLLADSDSDAIVADVSARLSSPTRRVVSGALADESAVVEAFAKTAADDKLPPAGVIVFVGAPAFDGNDFDGALRRAEDLIARISAAAHAVVDAAESNRPRLWLVTRDGLSVHHDEPGDPAIGALKGLIRNWRFPGEAARVLAGEPDLGTALVDLGNAHDPVAALMSELGSPAGDDVIAWRADGRYVERLSRATLDAGQHEAVIRADGSYIVTGGLGGLGTVVTRWLVERGAGRIVLNGRREPSDDQRNALAELAGDTEITFVSGDIALPGVADRLVAEAEATGRPLRGLVHAAGVTGDGLVTALTPEGMQRVWAPKVAGALRLHIATVGRELDWWVGFSSMATLLGLPGQLAYATGNAWLDALMTWRRASGLPATAINWGQWSDVGMSHTLTYSVLDPITPDEGIEALESLVGGPLARVGVGRLRLDRAIAATPEFGELNYFERIVAEFDVSTVEHRPAVAETDQAEVSAPDWSQLSAEDRFSELETRLRTILGRELRMSASAINVDQPFPELGLDSMMAMTVLRQTQKLVGIDLSANMLFNHPTIASLATYVAGLLAPQEVPQEEAPDLIDTGSGVLDELFDQVESASAGSESGIF
ncbi:MAG TPA: type I polyketide synthase [Mycobacterium sp.]|nr:type I polyketide synthase [Mycobacterium sp.]